MHLLPLPLARLAHHTDRVFIVRFALNAISLRLRPGPAYEAAATNSKSLAVAGGESDSGTGFPPIPEFDDAPDGDYEGLIPVDEWSRVFAFARRLARTPSVKPVRGVAVKFGAGRATFAVSNGDVNWTHAVDLAPGQYPPYREIVAAFTRERLDARSSGKFGFPFDPGQLIPLLTTAGEFCGNRAAPTVEVECHGESRPVLVRAGGRDGAKFFGLVMPLVGNELIPEYPPTDAEPLERAYLNLFAERNRLASRVADLEALLAASRSADPVA